MLREIFHEIDYYLSKLSELHEELENAWKSKSNAIIADNDNILFNEKGWDYDVRYPIISRSFMFVSVMAFVEARFETICRAIDEIAFDKFRLSNNNKSSCLFSKFIRRLIFRNEHTPKIIYLCDKFLKEKIGINYNSVSKTELKLLSLIRNKIIHSNSVFNKKEIIKFNKRIQKVQKYNSIRFSDESSKVIIEKDFVHDVTLSYKQMFNEINVQLIDKGIIQKPSTMLDK
ncbi:MAG: hypothetical protein DRP35_05200 [Candidatus Zixiibacteriota bacterium]|nr:MAG: hypothetical protein DRP35_05200 [candidate division Zixibacteria bacterium]